MFYKPTTLKVQSLCGGCVSFRVMRVVQHLRYCQVNICCKCFAFGLDGFMQVHIHGITSCVMGKGNLQIRLDSIRLHFVTSWELEVTETCIYLNINICLKKKKKLSLCFFFPSCMLVLRRNKKLSHLLVRFATCWPH